MGLHHSVAVADAAFYVLTEQNFATLPAIQDKFGIYYYRRFKDDIMLVTSNRSGVRPFFEHMKTSAAPVFKMKLEDMSFASITMLAVSVHVRGGRFVCVPRDKPQGVPLTKGSAHHRSISRWPRSQLRNIQKMCSLSTDAASFTSQFMEWLLQYGFSHRDLVHGDITTGTTAHEIHDVKTLWLVLRYHPALNRASFTSLLRDVSHHNAWSRMLD